MEFIADQYDHCAMHNAYIEAYFEQFPYWWHRLQKGDLRDLIRMYDAI